MTEAVPRTNSPIASPFVPGFVYTPSRKGLGENITNKIERREKTEHSRRSHRRDNHPTDLFYLVPPHGRASVPLLPSLHPGCFVLMSA